MTAQAVKQSRPDVFSISVTVAVYLYEGGGLEKDTPVSGFVLVHPDVEVRSTRPNKGLVLELVVDAQGDHVPEDVVEVPFCANPNDEVPLDEDPVLVGVVDSRRLDRASRGLSGDVGSACEDDVCELILLEGGDPADVLLLDGLSTGLLLDVVLGLL